MQSNRGAARREFKVPSAILHVCSDLLLACLLFCLPQASHCLCECLRHRQPIKSSTCLVGSKKGQFESPAPQTRGRYPLPPRLSSRLGLLFQLPFILRILVYGAAGSFCSADGRAIGCCSGEGIHSQPMSKRILLPEYIPGDHPIASLTIQGLPALVTIGNESAEVNMCSMLGRLPLVLL